MNFYWKQRLHFVTGPMPVLALLLITSLPSPAWEVRVIPAAELPGAVEVPRGQSRPRMLPDAVVVVDRHGNSAWLADPTRRYTHGVLGDEIEAGALTLQTAGGARLRLLLPEYEVFEDRYPRFADLNGDGDDEIYLVLTHLYRGAALAVVDLRGGELVIAARTRAIGQRFRWLNPVGAGDFDGDGRMEIAVVITPHIGGTLRLYEYRDGRLVPEYEAEGFSNHAIGSRELGLSAVADVNGDGRPDLAVPDADRRALRLMSVQKQQLLELGRIDQGSRIRSAILLSRDDAGQPVLDYRLEDGRGIEVRLGQGT